MVNYFEKQKTNNEQAIANYLAQRCATDEYLRVACQKENKTMKECMNYITSEAEKLAKDNVAMVEDSVVYDWAVHYILEDSIANAEPVVVKTAYKPETVKETKHEVQQLSLF